MKTYIIFTTQVTTMGGAQMYIRNKVLYLKDKGWETGVIKTERISEEQYLKETKGDDADD